MLTLEWQAIKKQNQDLLTELAANSKRHAKDIEKRKSDHDAELATQAQRHQCAVDHLKRQHSVELDQVRVRHAADSAAQARTVLFLLLDRLLFAINQRLAAQQNNNLNSFSLFFLCSCEKYSPAQQWRP